MKWPHKLSSLSSMAAVALILSSFHVASAQQQSEAGANLVIMDCPDMAYEVAYETPPEFIAWLLARPERMNVIADAELGAMFRAFAERQQLRNRIAMGNGAKG